MPWAQIKGELYGKKIQNIHNGGPCCNYYSPCYRYGDTYSKEFRLPRRRAYLVSTTDEKMIAPDFTVFDIDREETHLSEHLGKKAVVSFWATWSRPCKSMLSNFNKVYEENQDDVEFMMINLTDGMDETIEVADEYVKDSKISIPVYYDLSYSADHAYHVETLPLTVFIDENGYISDIHQGSLTKSRIEEYISAIGTTGEILQ